MITTRAIFLSRCCARKSNKFLSVAGTDCYFRITELKDIIQRGIDTRTHKARHGNVQLNI